MATTKLLTIEDLAGLDDTPGRFDLIRGELIEMPPAGAEHGDITHEISRTVGNFVVDKNLGKVYAAETGFIIGRNPDILLGPDIAFVRRDRLPRERHPGFLELAPDLAVEVVSPSDRQRDVTRKVIEYLDAGVRIVWLVDPADKVVTVFTSDRKSSTLSNEDVLDGGDVLPGFRLPLADVFR